jgi:hypothetical protein
LHKVSAQAETGRARKKLRRLVKGLAGKTKMVYFGVVKTLSIPLLDDGQSAAPRSSYEQWFASKVAASLADPRPATPHAQLIEQLRAGLRKGRARDCDQRKSR